jgi:hypothetical protein
MILLRQVRENGVGKIFVNDLEGWAVVNDSIFLVLLVQV